MKNMSWYKFGVKIVVFLLIAIFVDLIIGKTFDLMGDYNYAKNPHSVPSDYMVKDLESEIVILGASIASRHYIPSIIEDSLKMSTYNCGFDGTPFIVQNALLNLLLDRYKPRIVVWEIGETSMEIEKDIKHVSYLYPYYNGNKQVREIVNGINQFQVIRMLSNSYRYNSNLLNELNILLTSRPHSSQNDLKGYMPLDTVGYIFPNKIHKKYNNDIDISKIQLLEKTIIRCKESGVLMVFSSSPRYIENYDEIKTSQSYLSIVDVANKYNVPILDFYELFSNDSILFKDNAHMNDNGTRKYMSVFIPKLREVIYATR